jgi:hypothetical protein
MDPFLIQVSLLQFPDRGSWIVDLGSSGAPGALEKPGRALKASAYCEKRLANPRQSDPVENSLDLPSFVSNFLACFWSGNRSIP